MPPPGGTALSLRRTHKKSRLGCQECKRRHVKCDETHPSCRNCHDAYRTCVYQPRQARAIRQSSTPSRTPQSEPDGILDPISRSTTAAPSPTSIRLGHQLLTPAATASSASTPRLLTTSSAQDGVLNPPLNMRHMELLSHFIVETIPSLDDGRALDRERFQQLMPNAFAASWLMHELLALSAMHLSRTRPAEAKHYREEATALQNMALSLFKDNVREIDAGNCAASLMFASFLGLHSLTEAVEAAETDGDGFLDKYVTYLNLHRGVRAVTQQSWGLLLQSSISPFITEAQSSLSTAELQAHQRATIVFEHLSNLMDQTDMNEASGAACRDAIAHLKRVYQVDEVIENTPQSEQRHTNTLISAWPVLLSSTFTDLLLRRRPEALIILCHYAVLLHRMRHSWLVGNGGRMLIDEITKALGSYWRNWLDWPNEVLQEG